MARTKNKKSTAKKKTEPIDVKISNFLSSKKTKSITAVIFFLLTIAFFISYISFLFTWKSDQSVLNMHIIDYMFNTDIKVQNAVGKVGLILAHLLVYNLFGLPAITLTLLFLIVSLKMIGVKRFNYGKIISNILFYTLWMSVTLAFFEDSNTYILGGKVGDNLGNWLITIFGEIITGLILASALFLYAFYTFEWFNKQAIKLYEYAINTKPKENREDTNSNSSKKKSILNFKKEKDKEKDKTDAKNLDFEVVNSKDDKITENINYTLNDKGKKIEPANSDFEIHDTSQDDEEDSDTELTSRQNDAGIVPNIGSDLYDNLQLNVSSNEEILAESINNRPTVNFDPKLDLSNYKIPSIDLLNKISSKFEINNEELLRNKKRIVKTLKDYNIGITKIKATVGPTITLYEIVPQAGVRISKIKNLEDDIALSLAALGIRIIAPMPGRGTIGIEVPNEKPQIVSLRSVIRSKKFQESNMELPIALGKTISNEAYVFDLTKMPHLLVAGATGQGKSVGLNVIISSILYKKHPAEVKFVIVDPKKVEMTQFERLNKHFLATLPNNDTDELIVTDNQKVLDTVKALNVEMDNRYQILKKAMARNIKEYNKKFTERKLNPENGHRYLPYIVLIIDEFADLIMTAGKKQIFLDV